MGTRNWDVLHEDFAWKSDVSLAIPVLVPCWNDSILDIFSVLPKLVGSFKF